MGDGGVSGACPAESSRAGHPEGRKRRSGWDAGTDIKGWTRELAFDEWICGLWLALVLSAEPTAPRGWRRSAKCGSLSVSEPALQADSGGVSVALMKRNLGSAERGCLDITSEWADIQVCIVTC